MKKSNSLIKNNIKSPNKIKNYLKEHKNYGDLINSKKQHEKETLKKIQFEIDKFSNFDTIKDSSFFLNNIKNLHKNFIDKKEYLNKLPLEKRKKELTKFNKNLYDYLNKNLPENQKKVIIGLSQLFKIDSENQSKHNSNLIFNHLVHKINKIYTKNKQKDLERYMNLSKSFQLLKNILK